MRLSNTLWEAIKAVGFLIALAMLIFIVYRELKPKKTEQKDNQTTIIKEMVEQDALMKEVNSLRFKVDSVKNSVYNSDILLRSMDSNFTEQFNKLQKIRNEKFNPPSASMREQYDVITTARYSDF